MKLDLDLLKNYDMEVVVIDSEPVDKDGGKSTKTKMQTLQIQLSDNPFADVLSTDKDTIYTT